MTPDIYTNHFVINDKPLKEKHSMPCDCPSCQKDNILNGTLKGKCANCQCELDALSKFQIMGDKTLVCDRCVAENYIECICCQKLHKKDNIKRAKYQNKENSPICLRCFSLHYRECDECHESFDRNEVLGH
jgi:hypothetical protein